MSGYDKPVIEYDKAAGVSLFASQLDAMLEHSLIIAHNDGGDHFTDAPYLKQKVEEDEAGEIPQWIADLSNELNEKGAFLVHLYC